MRHTVLLLLALILGKACAFIVPQLPPRILFGRRHVVESSFRHHHYMTSSSSSTDENAMIEAQDGEALQALFAKQCDKDGLMTKEMLQAVPAIKDLLDDEDLQLDELNDIWEAAPKFPDVSAAQERIDVDSFVQIYRDIDDLFEDNDDDEEEQDFEDKVDVSDITSTTTTPMQQLQQDEDPEEEELTSIFKSICDEEELISKERLYGWDEMQSLFQEGLLGEQEFEAIWEKTLKSPGSQDKLDVEGFLSFNVALDDLFVFDDDEEDVQVKTRKSTMDMVQAEDMPPGVLFAALADEDLLVGMDELERWGDLQDMLAEETLLPLELQNIYEGIPKKENDKLDEAGFIALYEAIDSLFEEVDEEEEEQAEESPPTVENVAKKELLEMLADLNSDTERLPCGLECTEREEKRVMNIVNELEKSPSNLVQLKQGNLELIDLAGSWELLYSSSSAMKFNKGLSGLGGSVPNGKFAGLVQKLTASKYMADVEYVERIEVNPDTASFDVLVTGDWDLRTSVSLFTGAPSTVMTVEPAKVMYGPTSTKADHWKSLGPMNMLDVTYLDEDLRIMRGNTATDAIFVFQRTA